MTFKAEAEFAYMYDKLDYFGQKRWLNVILPAWEEAYRAAYKRVVKAVSRKTTEAFGASDVLGLIVGQGSFGVQLIYAPLASGLKKLLTSEPTYPSEPDKSPEEFVSSRKLEFGRMLAAASRGLMDLRDKARGGTSSVTEAEFDRFRSMALVSPIWYPPPDPDTGTLADRVERRMWAKSAERIVKDPDYGMDLTGMAGRLGDLKQVKTPFENRMVPSFGGNVYRTQLNIKYIESLRPWVRSEMERHGPFHCDLPDYTNQYMMILGWRQNPFIPKTTVDQMLARIPYVRRDYSVLKN